MKAQDNQTVDLFNKDDSLFMMQEVNEKETAMMRYVTKHPR